MKPSSDSGALTTNDSVKLILLDRLRSGASRKGDRVNFKVDEDVYDNSKNLVIAKGTEAFGTIMNSRPSGAWGRRGALDVSVDYTFAVDGQKVPLRAQKNRVGGGNKGLMTAGAILVAWPLAFCRGSNVTLEAGTQIVAFVDDNIAVAMNGTHSENGAPRAEPAVAESVVVPDGHKLITLNNGDRFVGRITGMNSGAYTIETAHGSLKIKEEDIKSIAAN